MKQIKIKSDQRIAIFSIGRQATCEDKKKKESLLWQEFCKNGGDPNALSAFYDFGREIDGLVLYLTMEEFQQMLRETVINKSRNPAEYVKTY